MKILTVGPQNADITGSDNRAIQTAIDRLAPEGGGTVQLLPGTYTCYDAVRMRSNIRLTGDRENTVLAAGPTPSSPLAEDADIGEKQITPICTDGFEIGMGVVLRDRTKPHTLAPMPLTITKIENGTLFVDDWITHDWIAEEGGLVVAYTPLIHAFEVDNITIDNLTMDGTKTDAPDHLEGFRGGNFYARRVNGVQIRNVISRNAYGDGIRCGQSTDMIVEDCETHDNGYYGIHPGSHTRPIRFSRLHIHHNASDGLYLCWGVQNGLIEECDIHHNGHVYYRNGISIGHKDTDNTFINNHIWENCKMGIAFRIKTEANGAHRNTLRGNLIENNGSRPEDIPADVLEWLPEVEKIGCGIDVQPVTHDLLFKDNIIRETREGDARTQQIGIQLAAEGVTNIEMTGNTVEGHPLSNIADPRCA